MKRLLSRPWMIALLILGLGWGILWFFAGRHVSTGPAQGDSFEGLPALYSAGLYLRLGTFNIDGGQGTDGITDLSRTAKCLQRLDFIGMQEVHGFLNQEPSNQAIALSAELKLPYLWAPAERQWWHESFGNAVFTDLPVSHWERVVLPNRPLAANRNYVLTDVQWHGIIVHIIATHVDFKAGGDEQFQIVANRFLSLPEPAVLLGDLNHPQSHPLIQALLHHAGVQEAIDTFLGPQPKRVDWIFLRGLQTMDAGSVDLHASDHLAYWAAVKLSSPVAPATTTAAARLVKPD